jgi:hypothetical protein
MENRLHLVAQERLQKELNRSLIHFSSMPRLPKGSRGDNRHNPLHLQITQDQFATSKGAIGAPAQGRSSKTGNDNTGMSSDEEESGLQSIDARTSSKILSLARKQQDEEGGDQEDDSRTLPKGSVRRASAAIKKKTFEEDDEDEEAFGLEADYDAEGAYDELVCR